jgi:hypothetical protein
MSYAQIFSLSGLTVMPFWALMILLPRWRVTQRIMRSPLVAALPALLYAALVLPRAGAIFASVSRPELAPIAALLGSPEGATIFRPRAACRCTSTWRRRSTRRSGAS